MCVRVRVYVGVCVKVTSVCFIGQSISSSSTVKYQGRVYGVSRKLVWWKHRCEGAVCVYRACVYICLRTNTNYEEFLVKMKFLQRNRSAVFFFFLFKLFSKSSRCIISSSFSFSVFFSPFFITGSNFWAAIVEGEDLFDCKLEQTGARSGSFWMPGDVKDEVKIRLNDLPFLKIIWYFLGTWMTSLTHFLTLVFLCLYMCVLIPDTELSR